MNQDIKVSHEEILKYDPMIMEHIEREIFKYWANGVSVQSRRFDVTIGRLGAGVEDLMQFGRMHVLTQLRWFKANGYDASGKVKNAKESTMMYNHLRNKFQSLSRTFANSKHGGQIVNVEENRRRLQDFLDMVAVNPDMTTEQCSAALNEILVKCQQEIQRMVKSGLYRGGQLDARRFPDIKSICRHICNKIANMETALHTSYESISDFDIPDLSNPEADLLAQEGMLERMSGVKVAPNPRKITHPEFNPRGTNFLMVTLGKRMGFKTQGALAKQLGVGVTTLSNILHSRGDGSEAFRDRVRSMFGMELNELRVVGAEAPV